MTKTAKLISSADAPDDSQGTDKQFSILKPEPTPRLPLDVPGIDLNVSTQEILDLIRESRERH